MISKMGSSHSLESQRLDLLTQHREIAQIMMHDLQESVRVSDMNANSLPGIRREPNVARASASEDDSIIILIQKYPQFPIPARFTANPASIRFFAPPTIGDTAEKLYRLHKDIARDYKIYLVSAGQSKSAVLVTSRVTDGAGTTLNIDTTGTTTIPFANSQITIQPLLVVKYYVSNNSLIRETKYSPTDSGYLDRKVLLKNVVSPFHINYEFFDYERKPNLPLLVPTSPISHPSENDALACSSGSAGANCASWQHIGRLILDLTTRSPHTVKASLSSQNEEGLSIVNDRLTYHSQFTLFPYGYMGIGGLIAQTGTDMECSPLDQANQCNPNCAGSRGKFRSPIRSAPDWEGYGRPMFNADGTAATNPSDYCVCGTHPDTKKFIPPTTDAGRTDSQMPYYDGTPAMKNRFEACARDLNLCGEHWAIRQKYPVAYVACHCVQSNDPTKYYEHSQWPFALHSDQVLSFAANPPAQDIKEVRCKEYANCDSYARAALARAGQTGHDNDRYWRNQCRCMTSNENASGAIEPSQQISPEWHLSYFDVCSLNASQGNGPTGDGYCPNTYDIATGRYKLYDATRNPQGLSSNLAMLCQCLRTFWQARAGFSDPNGSTLITRNFSPSNGASYSNWDFRKAAPSGQTPWTNFGLNDSGSPSNQLNRTWTSAQSETIAPSTASTWDSSQNPGITTLANSTLGGSAVIDCSAAHLATSMAYSRSASNCTQPLTDSDSTTAGVLPQYQAWSGYCRNTNAQQETRADSPIRSIRQYVGPCGDTNSQVSAPEVYAVRKIITNTADGQPLPETCGGPPAASNSGSGSQP